MKTYRLMICLSLFLTVSASGFAVPEAPKDQAEVVSRLDKLLKSQAEILQRLEEIKQELYIVKVRATKR